ncbi:butyrophilin subfamily 3 member A2-like isoform X2 [Betta splendens]|uniref:Butyrophilin subfamily 3 member A2-like isoform X2 n=1 Tax=Betta splendens TaxID=158456 RepID=A0A8M1HL96_BETSP|nr:butyrophilin subfamily 3 member A2-like isoform X2 [Betta splendens]
MCVRMRQRADPHPQCQDTRMFSLNSGRLLMSLSALVLLCSVILVLLTDSSSAQPLEAASSHTVTALAGEDVVLPCHLEPAADVVSQSLEWGRLDLNPRFIHVWHEGQDLLLNQNPSYRGRTSLSTEKLKHGDLSLTLSALTHSDNGRYRCYFPSTAKTAEVELLVGSVSSPVIAAVTVTSDVVVLECRSGGWFPEPELLWLDAEGKLLSAGPTETVRGSDDLYTVSSRVTVDKRHSSRYTCRVQQTSINHTSEAHIEVTAECFAPTSCSVPRLSIVSTVSVVFICAAAFFVWKWTQNLIKETKRLQTDEKERKELLAEIKKSKLDNERQKKKEERKHLEHLVDVLMEQRNELLNLSEQLMNQHKDMDTQHKDTDEKLESADEESDRMKRFMKLKEITIENQQQLKNRQRQHEELEMKTRSLANNTEAVIRKMREEINNVSD